MGAFHLICVQLHVLHKQLKPYQALLKLAPLVLGLLRKAPAKTDGDEGVTEHSKEKKHPEQNKPSIKLKSQEYEVSNI
jgi:hypothetical protein